MCMRTLPSDLRSTQSKLFQQTKCTTSWRINPSSKSIYPLRQLRLVSSGSAKPDRSNSGHPRGQSGHNAFISAQTRDRGGREETEDKIGRQRGNRGGGHGRTARCRATRKYHFQVSHRVHCLPGRNERATHGVTAAEVVPSRCPTPRSTSSLPYKTTATGY